MKYRSYTIVGSCLVSFSLALSGCGSENSSRESGVDSSMGGAVQVEGPACDSNADCDDAVFCNGEEACVQGFCQSGSPFDCDDGVECTIDRCIEAMQTCESVAPDMDGDGHGDANCEDSDGAPLGDDCDDNDALAYPGNNEVCDPENRDEDCDPNTFGTQDADQDGYIDALCCNENVDGEFNCGDDCDDFKTNVNPAGTEACDFLDNNCDGEIDEGVSLTMYEDKDHDGRGDDDAGTVQSCAGAVGFATIDGDCDDNDPEVFDGQFEICDDKDNNCNGEPDEVQEQAPWYKDVDGDGYGDPESTPVFSCYRIPGRVLSQNDCSDNNNKVNPNATEICDGLDNDCNGLADFRLAGVNNFEDDDGDGAADSDCGGTDCNDHDPRTAQGAVEVCDHVDNDCDGEVDEQTVQNIWYIDEDGDGWGVVIGSALASCDPIPNRASKFGDCDDNDRERKPGTAEICDGIDQDCDGLIDEGAGSSCHLPNALSTCRAGGCAVFSCVPGYADADNDPENGCESAVNPDDLLDGRLCTYDHECSDGDLCDGIETCHMGACRDGSPVNCAVGGAVVEGDVVITNGFDLRALEGIETITGTLVLNSTAVSSLSGLESLRVIGRDLIIVNNENLGQLAEPGLSDLELVGGDITIEANQSLRSVGLPSLISARSLTINNNDALVTVDGFTSLTSIDQLLTVRQNDILREIQGFDSLVQVGGAHDTNTPSCDGVGGIVVETNVVLEPVSFQALSDVDGDLCFQNSLEEAVLPNLVRVGQDVMFGLLPNLVRVDVPLLESAYSFRVLNYGGTSLSQVTADALVEVAGEVRLQVDGEALQTVAFPALADADGVTVHVQNPADLFDSFDLSSLATTEFLSLVWSGDVAGVDAVELPALTDVTTNIDIAISSPIRTLRLPELDQVGGYINLSLGSDDLDFVDFPSLVSTGSHIFFNYNGAGQLSGVDLGDLTTIGGNGQFRVSTAALDISQLVSIGPTNRGSLEFTVAPADVCSDIARLNVGAFDGIISGDQTCP